MEINIYYQTELVSASIILSEQILKQVQNDKINYIFFFDSVTL